MKPLIPILSLQVTYQCNIECKHCGPFCGPRETDWMTVEEIESLIRQADGLGARVVVFTGGEPSLLGEKLNEVLRFIKRETSIVGTRIVTNGKWATSDERARVLLAGWKAAGLDELNISCGEFHQEFVPIESVARAYKAGCDVGFKTVLLAGEFLAPGRGHFSPRDFAAAVGEPLLPPELLSPYSETCRGMRSGAAMCAGRGAHLIDRADVITSHESTIKGRCDEVFSSITAHPNGNLTACCGVMVREDSLLTIGNWRRDSLKAIMEDAQEDLVLNWIRYLGLTDMKAWLRSKDPSLEFRTHYTGICDLCQDLMFNPKCQELLIDHGAERAAEIVAHKLAIDTVTYESEHFQYAPQDSNPGTVEK